MMTAGPGEESVRKVAFGWKAHSGWAALVVLAERDGDLLVMDRRRVELAAAAWEKQPYHAAENKEPATARALVTRAIASARRRAVDGMRDALRCERERGHDVVACAVLMGEPMPAWSTAEILAVHFRMHKAEGTLFRDVLARAATRCGVRLVAVPEKQLEAQVESALGRLARESIGRIAALRAQAGPPWGKDQKDAALAALLGLQAQPAARTRPPGARERRRV